MERLTNMVQPTNSWTNSSEQKVILVHRIDNKLFNLIENKTGKNNCIKCYFNNESQCPEIEKLSGGSTLLCGAQTDNYFLAAPAVQPTAPNMLKRASELMIERASQYDSPEGERSMEKIVEAFNAITGKGITESQGWLLMVLLKLVRDNTRAVGHLDSCEDLIAYASLYGESRLNKKELT